MYQLYESFGSLISQMIFLGNMDTFLYFIHNLYFFLGIWVVRKLFF